MNNYQILHYHFTLNLNEISFLELGDECSLIAEVENLKAYREDFQKEIKSGMDLLLTFLEENNEALIYFSTSFLEMLEKENLSTLNKLQQFVKNGQIELVASCAYHSFSYLCHPELFKKEVAFHKQSYKKYFGKEARLFINTACLFEDHIIEYLEGSGFETVVATANSWHLKGINSAKTYQTVGDAPMNILLSIGNINSNTYVNLANGYGSAYNNNSIEHSSLESLRKQVFEAENRSIYSASMPLSSPEWKYPISNYLSNPLQKALLDECRRLVNQYLEKLTDDDWKVIMLICQPDRLIRIKNTEKDNAYQLFINSMNILTAIGFKHR